VTVDLDSRPGTGDNLSNSYPADLPSKASVGLFFCLLPMTVEPAVKRAIAYVDGQNLFNSAKDAFGYSFPNYDIKKLALSVCASRGWTLVRVRFYTGIPDLHLDPNRHNFWSKKLAALGRLPDVQVYSRPLAYQGTMGREKGIDVRLALDALHDAHQNEFDIALIFSQDQDLSEVGTLIRQVSALQNRWLKIASAYPSNPLAGYNRGINKTDWCPIDKATYDACIDPRDYRK